MTDPTLKRFERDALVQTHQRRIRELEEYVKKMELKVNEVQSQLDQSVNHGNLNTLDLPVIMISNDN
jgi:phosphopantetheine adenylyltransferase